MKQMGCMLLTVALIIGGALVVQAAEIKNGAEELTIVVEKKGDVWFPHRQHQDNLGDCKICHDLFPQEAGTIQKMKADGTLKKKQVMNKKCLSCHRKMKKMNKPAGPTSCKKCHQKK
jgi:hypothetical protein